MKNPSFQSRATLAVLAASLAAFPATSDAYVLGADTPFVHESYDKNPLGDMLNANSAGYGVNGTYAAVNATTPDMFRIVNEGLAFGPLGSTTGRSALLTGTAQARGIAITIDGGRARGDLDFFFYDKLYCSYLVKYISASADAGARAEVRIVSGGANYFQVHSDGAGLGGKIQPSLMYSGSTFNIAPQEQALISGTLASGSTPATDGVTYLMIGKFNQVGNAKSISQSATWVAGDSFVTISNATNAATFAIGNLLTGTGLGDDSRITAINGAVVTLSKPTVTGATASVSLTARPVLQRTYSALGKFTAASTTVTGISNTSSISVGQYVTGTGIAPGTTVQQISSSTSIVLSTNPTADSPLPNGRTLRYTTISPVTASWNSGVSPNQITVSRNDNILVGQAVLMMTDNLFPPSAAVPAVVTAVSGTTVTLSQAVVGTRSGITVNFLPLTGHSSLYALTLPQYETMMAAAPTINTREATINAYLDNTAIGPASNQITTRIKGNPQISGSAEFGQGSAINLVVGGVGNTYRMDELRYGPSAISVVAPAAYQTDPTPATLEVADRFDDLYSDSGDGGYGWKSGYYVYEETRSPQGARIYTDSATLPLSPGSGSSLAVITRSAVASDQGIRRRPDPAVVNMTQPYTVEFEFRLNSGITGFTSYTDRFHFAADVNGTALNSTATNSWAVGVIGGDTGGQGIKPREWYFYNNALNDATFVRSNMVETQISMEPGRTYRFKIEVDAPAKRYSATITALANSGGPELSFSARDMYCRSATDATTLLFATVRSGVEDRTFNLDNLVVTQGITDPDDYPAWIAAATDITAPADKVRTADPDKDGRPNFLEFALNSSASKGTASGTEHSTITTIDGLNYHTLTIPVRAGITFANTGTGNNVSVNSRSGLRYTIQGSYDLNFASASPPAVFAYNRGLLPVSPLPTLPALPAGWEYKTFRLPDPITSHPKGFIRAVVESTQPVAP